jgi:hypothetical protein
LAIDEPTIWRVSFAAFGAIGLVESALLSVRRGGLRAGRAAVHVADAASVILYGLAVLIALWTGLPDELGLDLRPLEAEGAIVAG